MCRSIEANGWSLGRININGSHYIYFKPGERAWEESEFPQTAVGRMEPARVLLVVIERHPEAVNGNNVKSSP